MSDKKNNEIAEIAKAVSDIEMDPNAIIVDIAVDALKNVIVATKEILINKEIEATKRTYIREQAKIAIAQIESDTSVYLTKIKNSHEERLKIIDTVQQTLQNRSASEIKELSELCIKLLEITGVGKI